MLGRRGLIAVGLSFALLAGVTPSAVAAPQSPSSEVNLTQASLNNLNAKDSSLLLPSSDQSGIGTVPITGGSVDVPEQLSQGVKFTGPDRDQITMKLPHSGEARPGSVTGDGAIVYPGGAASNSVIVGDSQVQMLTTITSAAAPVEYSYDLSLSPGQRLELVNGGAAVVNPDGSPALIAGAPWAKDAQGAAVETSYRVEGTRLVQTVDHTTADVAYPVVADPIWLAPWAIRCLIGIGLNSTQISQIASKGSPWAIAAAFGWGAVRCVMGR